MNLTKICLAALIAASVHSWCYAGTVQITGGTTFIQLDENALRPLGLSVTAVEGADLLSMPGLLGYPINARTDDPATTFIYDADNLAPFSGTFEHTGSLTINGDTTVGDFQIAFAGDRPAGTSGFYAASTDPALILFDVIELTGEPGTGTVDFTETYFNVDAPLLIAPELADFLGDANLTGAVVGAVKKRALSEPVPEPASAVLAGLGCLAALAARKRRRTA